MGKHGTGKVPKTCRICDKKFHARQDRPGFFCSRSCQTIGRLKKPKTFIEFNCKQCNQAVKRRKGAGIYQYCSIQCMANARGKIMAGANHPKWKGGTAERTHASKTIIRMLIGRIGKCEKCNSIDNLQGHHKVPYSESIELREDLNNIQVLCIDCHALEHPEFTGFIKRRAING